MHEVEEKRELAKQASGGGEVLKGDEVCIDRCGFLFTVSRIPTSSGNHGKPGKSPKKVPCMEESWNLKKTE